MTPRAAVRLAWGLWGLAVGLMVAGFAVNPRLVLTGEPGILIVLSLVFITTGAFLAGRRPANPVGWLLGGWGMVMAFGTFTTAYVDKALVRDHSVQPDSASLWLRPRMGPHHRRGGWSRAPEAGGAPPDTAGPRPLRLEPRPDEEAT